LIELFVLSFLFNFIQSSKGPDADSDDELSDDGRLFLPDSPVYVKVFKSFSTINKKKTKQIGITH